MQVFSYEYIISHIYIYTYFQMIDILAVYRF